MGGDPSYADFSAPKTNPERTALDFLIRRTFRRVLDSYLRSFRKFAKHLEEIEWLPYLTAAQPPS